MSTTDISSILLNTGVEGRFYDIWLNTTDHDGKKVVVSVFTDAVKDDESNDAIVLSSTVVGDMIQVEITDEDLTTLLHERDDSADLQFIVRSGATKLGSIQKNLTKVKMVIPKITFFSDQGNDNKATVKFDISYGSFTQYHTHSTMSSVIVEYHLEGDSDATVIECSSGNGLTINDTQATITIDGLTNEKVYEYIVTGLNSAGETNYITGKVRPVNKPLSPTITKVNSIVEVSGNPNASNVNITITWEDADAAGYKSSRSNEDASNSTLKLRIGTNTDISYNQYTFDVSNVSGLHEVFLTNAQLDAAAVGPIELKVFNVNIMAMDASANTTGVALKAQMLPSSMEDADALGRSGQLSEENNKIAYIDTVPTLADITVSLDASNGTQTFTVNGTVPSEDSTGVTLTIDNSGSSVKDLSGTVVLTDGSLNITEASTEVSYDNLSGNPVITATLSQVDRNGTLDSSNIYVYSATATFQAYQLKIPSAPTVTFLGNATDGSKLRTQITNLNNNGDQFDVAATDVRYELVDANGTVLDPAHDVSYTGLNVDNDISYNYINSKDYYLKATKYASLNDTVADVYSADISQNQEIETEISAPRKATTSTSLELASIKLTVDANGEQTFYFNGTINSLDASGAKLTMSDGSDNFIDQQYVYINDTGVITEISGSRTYAQLSANHAITATLSQPDLNGGGFDISANVSFEAYAFKTPAAPDASGSLSKNLVGNDGKLRANYQNNDLKDMNGYDLVNVTGEMDLADISGVFDTAVNTEVELNVNTSANQTIDLSGDYTVDSSYSMILKKGYALDSGVYAKYKDAQKDTSVTDLSAGVVNSSISNTVYYMGNPEITGVAVSGVADTVTVSVSTHGADLTSTDAVTLVLIAKDGLAGYASGTNTGNMGSTVLALGSAAVVGYAATLGNQDVTAVFDLSGVDITDGATSVVIVDAENSHSAITLSNFPTLNTTLNTTYNSSTN